MKMNAKQIQNAWTITAADGKSEKREFNNVISLEEHSLSLPGFKTFLIPNSSILRRVIWLAIFALLIGLCAMQITERVRFFLQYPVSTAFAVKFQSTFRFPNISLCMVSPQATTRMLRSINLSSYDNEDVYRLLERPGFSLEDLWDLTHENITEFVKSCTYNRNKDCRSPEYWSQENMVAGKCHILTINEDVPYVGSKSSILLTIRDFKNVTAMTTANALLTWKLLLHNQYYNRKFGSYIQGLSIYPNTWAKYRYWEEEFRYENTPVRPCASPFNYSACMQECYERQYYLNQPKCKLPFTVNAIHYPPCTAEQFRIIYNFSLIDMMGRIDTSTCECVRPCLDLNYDIKPDIRKYTDIGNDFEPGAGWPGIPVTRISIIPGRGDVESMYEVRSYTLTSLVSDIGGALGLYLGACILTFFEIINLAYQAILIRFSNIIYFTKK